MNKKTSITMAEDLLAAVDRRAAASGQNRSDFIERAVTAYLIQVVREEQDARDREIIDREAERLNAEAAEVLEFQVIA
ncbi:MAG TPA: ribbon-helix-helix protein, CopG family [Polyangia bacterium]|jgi:metal-responsive CopG/Arc/MetJ family transcriptional regulator